MTVSPGVRDGVYGPPRGGRAVIMSFIGKRSKSDFVSQLGSNLTTFLRRMLLSFHLRVAPARSRE